MLCLRRTIQLLALLCTVSPVACGPGAPEPALPVAVSASAAASTAPASPPEPPDGPMPTLRTGAVPRIDMPQAIEGRVTARTVADGFETLAIQITPPAETYYEWENTGAVVVSVDGAPTGPHAFVEVPQEAGAAGTSITLWIRRPRAEQGKPIAGAFYLPQAGDVPGRRQPFHVTVDPASKNDPTLGHRWGRALAADLRARGSSPFHEFASARLDEVFAEKARKPAPGASAPARLGRRTAELSRLMDTTTGAMSIQEALQADRPLLLGVARAKPTVPLAKLSPPRSAPHPWEELARALGKTAPAEPLAAAVPAEFYYLRAADLDVLFKLTDQLDAWATPIAGALDHQAVERGLATRYETQLGLARTALARALGKEVVGQIALVGSDPYVREGTDLSVVFQVARRTLFDVGLAGTLSTRAAEHGGVTTTTVAHDGVDVRIATSADGAVRQHRATVGDLEIVSNSLAATRRIVDTLKGKHPRLADEKDFAYLLARDAGVRADALGFMGDRFVAAVVGPRQKVLETRRQIALAELMTPGFAALLSGWMTGRAPDTAAELVTSRLLGKGELTHGSGAPIAWKPGEAARSSFGTPAALTPLIELPDPVLVTEAEREAYDQFSHTYETYWRTYIDPAALRVAVDTAATGTALTADLRVVPLIEGTDYREILEIAGQARVTAPPLGRGARAVVGIGANAHLRRELARLTHSFAGSHDFGLDFLGEWAMIGCDDRAPLATTVAAVERRLPQRPEVGGDRAQVDDKIEIAARTPAYVAIGIKSVAGATLALAALHGLAGEVLPDGFTWSGAGKERDVPLVRIAVTEAPGRHRPGGAEKPAFVEVFYALTDGVFFAALRESTLRRLVDEQLDGHGPGPAPTTSGSQLVVDLAGEKQGALFTVLAWLLAQESLDAERASRALAEALFVGAGERAGDPAAVRALAVAYLGAMPVPSEGGAWTLGPDGMRDPHRGSASAPMWPALPVPGSGIDKLLGAVGRFRSEVAFDREGPGKGSDALLSLHARVTLGLRGE